MMQYLHVERPKLQEELDSARKEDEEKEKLKKVVEATNADIALIASQIFGLLV